MCRVASSQGEGSQLAEEDTAIAVVCCSLVLAGTAAALSPAQYRSQANAVCLDLHRKINKLPDPKTRRDVLPYLRRGIAIASPAAKKIRALVPPPSLATRHALVVRLTGQQEVLLNQVVAKLAAGKDPETTIDAADPTLTRLSNREQATWRQMGVAECAKSA